MIFIKEKKKKVWIQILILIILVILLIFIIIISRKATIISSLESKLQGYQQQNNIYSRTTFESQVDMNSLKIQSFEIYYKDGVEKDVITSADNNTKIIQYVYEDKIKIYSEKNGNTEFERENDSGWSNHLILSSATSSDNLFDLFYNSILTSIKTENLDGTDCYVLTSKHNSSWLYDENCKEIQVYVEKDTGLVKQVKNILEVDGQEKGDIRTSEYSFGTVTDADITEPKINTQAK